MKLRRSIDPGLLLIAGLVLHACGVPPTSPPDPSGSLGQCGDGLCDEAEAADASLCPQDCPPDSTSPLSPTVQPNIVFILVDDLDASGYEHMPQLQALLAQEGTTLSNFLISMPLCCPSRASILRGQYGHSTEIMGNDLPYGGFFKFSELGEEESTCATWLQSAGYQTMLVGKYLNAFPDASDLMHIPPGWSEWYSPMEGEPYTEYDYVLNANGAQVAYGSDAGDYGTDVYAELTLDFLQRMSETQQPFFAHVSLYAPHWPATPAPRHASLFSDAQAPRTPNFNEQDVSDKPSYIRNLPLLTTDDIAQIDEEWRQRLRSMQAVDEMIGDIVDLLQSTGQLDNTYIFFTSDNGYHLGNHRQLLGKTAPYDEETRVTMIVRGPGVPAGQTVEHLTGNVDLAPTWADMAGVSIPGFVDGRSLLPLLQENAPALSEWRQWFLLEHAPFEDPRRQAGLSDSMATGELRTPQGLLEPPDPEDRYPTGTMAALASETEALPYRGLRSLDYLYVEYPTDERELYDLKQDPYQLDNIAASADPALLAALAERLEALASCSGETCRELEDAPLGAAVGASSEPLVYYLGYATQDNMQWIEDFDADVLTRGFLLFLNSNDSWLDDYEPRIGELQAGGKQFLAALQAAVLVENLDEIPTLGSGDPALAYPSDAIPQWEQYACRRPDGSTLKDAGYGFAHACLNDEAFRNFLVEKIMDLVDAGVDGVHIDELPTRYFAQHEGYCDACMEGFRTYLEGRYTPGELASLFGINDIATFDFRDRLADEGNLQAPPESPLHRQWWLFQLANLRDAEEEIFSAVRAYAQAQGQAFTITSNAFEPERNPGHVIELTMVDFASIGTGMTIQLRLDGQLVPAARIPPDYSYLPLYRMAQAVNPGAPVALFIDGPGGTGEMQAYSTQSQRDIVRWMFAEAYAAGARFHVPYPSLDYYAPLDDCQQYVQFIGDHREIYEGVEPLADVGVLFSYASEIWDYWVGASGTSHSLQWYGLAQALADLSIQFQAVFAPDGEILPDDLSLADLSGYETLIVPWAYSLRDEQVSLLEEFARGGGRLIVIGDFASVDELGNPRAGDAAAAVRQAGAILVPHLNLETYLNDPGGAAAGGVQEAVGDMIPERLVTVSNASVTAVVSSGAGALHVHLVNTERQNSGFARQSNFRVVLTLPPGFSPAVEQARLYSPDRGDAEPTLLRVTLANGFLHVTIPQLDVYAVLVIQAAD